jgi:two-component system response regulator YesN
MHTGTGMHEFLINYRINAAKEMLLNNHMSVEEICTAVGFKDMPHFSKSFKKHTDKSPCEYRKHN